MRNDSMGHTCRGQAEWEPRVEWGDASDESAGSRSARRHLRTHGRPVALHTDNVGNPEGAAPHTPAEPRPGAGGRISTWQAGVIRRFRRRIMRGW
jgi:hypothetical protein